MVQTFWWLQTVDFWEKIFSINLRNLDTGFIIHKMIIAKLLNCYLHLNLDTGWGEDIAHA